MNQPKTILLASGNKHKIVELRAMLDSTGIKLVSTLDYPDAGEVDEDQPDLEGNALKKARYWHQKTGLPALADDTGLEVTALQGEPGVYSARYAGPGSTDKENVEKLLRELSGKNDRTAQFRTVAALAADGEKLFEGICRGTILHEPRGSGGFGYDSVFRPAGYKESFAELSAEEKNSISHRGKALANVVQYLKAE
ncbi:MAG: RdgB/HAM1 family non-canonical purine NTP pyrophosphatase [Balneolaceae bacterium]